jgi:hypothetical protein
MLSLMRWSLEVRFGSAYLVTFVSATVALKYSQRSSLIPDPAQPRNRHQIEDSIALLHRCMRIILTRDATVALPLAYERVFALCRDTVVVYNKGETLADMLKIELDRSVARLECGLVDDISEGVWFASPFAQALTWFEKQVGLLEDVMTFLDRGYLIQTKEAKGIQFVPSSCTRSQISLADILVGNMRIACCYRVCFMIRVSTNDWVRS